MSVARGLTTRGGPAATPSAVTCRPRRGAPAARSPAAVSRTWIIEWRRCSPPIDRANHGSRTAGAAVTGAQQTAAPAQPQLALKWGPWVEPDFPFFSSVLDAARWTVVPGAEPHAARAHPQSRPRTVGRVRHRPLRVAAMWNGSGVTPRALAPGRTRTGSQDASAGSRRRPSPTAGPSRPTASIPAGRPVRGRRSTIRASPRRRKKPAAGRSANSPGASAIRRATASCSSTPRAAPASVSG